MIGVMFKEYYLLILFGVYGSELTFPELTFTRTLNCGGEYLRRPAIFNI